MARFFAILCLTAVLGITSAVPASETSRGGSTLNLLQCAAPVIDVNAFNCISANDNKLTAAVLGGAAQADCKQQCTNGSQCYSVKVFNSDGSQKDSYFKCCTADGSGNTVNCGMQECTATSNSGSTAGSLCCNKCARS